jgi:hypothetical protein
MTSESVSSSSSDPLEIVANAMDAAVKAAKEGAEGARATAAEAMPAATQFLSTVVYKTCYSISFGIVFPSMMLARSIPKNNAAVHGLIDGAHAALDMVNEMKPKSLIELPQ